MILLQLALLSKDVKVKDCHANEWIFFYCCLITEES